MSTQTGAEAEAGLFEKVAAHSLSMSVLPFKSQLRVASYTFDEQHQHHGHLTRTGRDGCTLTLSLIEVIKALLLVGCLA